MEVDEFTLFERIELRAFVQGTFHLTPCGTRTVRRGAVTALDAINLRHHAFVILGSMFEARAPKELMRQVRKNSTLVILLAALSPLYLAKILRRIDNTDSQATQRSHIVLHTQQRELRSLIQQGYGGNSAPFAHHRKRGIGDHRKDRSIGRRVSWIVHQSKADLRSRSIDTQIDLVITQQIETRIRIDRVQRKNKRLEDVARSVGIACALEERGSHRIDLRIGFEKALQLPERKNLPTFLQPQVLRVVKYRHHEREVAVLRSITFQIPDQRLQKRRGRIVEEIRSRVVGLPALHGNDKGLHARAQRCLVGNTPGRSD